MSTQPDVIAPVDRHRRRRAMHFRSEYEGRTFCFRVDPAAEVLTVWELRHRTRMRWLLRDVLRVMLKLRDGSLGL
jgi:hypothetical protein